MMKFRNHNTRKLFVLISASALSTWLWADPGSPEIPSVSNGLQGTIKMDYSLPTFMVSIKLSGEAQRCWIVFDQSGSRETDFTDPKKLIKYFRRQSADRQKFGIIIWGAFTHLKDPKSSKSYMTDFQKSLFEHPPWLEAERDFVSKLVDECQKKSIDLWINTGLSGKDTQCINLTR